MDRQKMIADLAELGFPADQLTDAVPDETLKAMLDWAQGNEDEDAAAEFAEGEESESDSEDEDKDDSEKPDEFAEGDEGDDEAEESEEDKSEEEQPADEQPVSEYAEDDDEPKEESEESDEASDESDESDHQEFMEMSRDEMIAALVSMGKVKDELDAMSDEELENLYNADVSGADHQDMMDDGMAASPGMESYAEGDAMGRDEMVNALLQAGHTDEDLKELSDEEIKDLYDAEVGSHASMSEGDADDDEEVRDSVPSAIPNDPASSSPAYNQNQPPPGLVVKPGPVEKMSEKLIRQTVQKVIREELTPALKTAKQQTSQILQGAKRANIRQFAENLVKEGRLLRSEVPSTIARLMRASVGKVYHFSDKKNPGQKVRKTELDLQMEELQARPIIVSFAERVGQPMTKLSSDVAKIKNHYQRFSDRYRKMGGPNLKKLVQAYKFLRKRRPDLTADEFIHQQPNFA
jgi:hypothetical protein